MTSPAPLAGFLDGSPVPLALVEPDEDRVLEVSEAFAAAVGRTPGELLREPLSALFEDSGRVTQRLEAVRRTGRPEPGFPARAAHTDEGLLVSAWKVGRDDASGHVGLMVVGGRDRAEPVHDELTETLRDVNEALLLKALRARDRAQDARAESRAKSVFLASVSHELRTPLNSIVGHAQLLMEGIPVELPGPLQSHVDRILTAAEHLLDLIRQIISASKSEVGEEIETTEVDLHELADEVRAMIESDAQAKDLAFRVAVDDSLTTIRSSRQHLRQILVNLLSNAVKFTEEGQIRLEIERAKSEGTGSGDAVRMRVSDSGIGIDEEQRERVFERFWQGGDAGIRPNDGMGIGLWVTRTLVEGLGGEIRLDSEPDEGTVFDVVLPVSSEESQPRETAGATA